MNGRKVTCLPYKQWDKAESGVRAARYDPLPHEAEKTLVISHMVYPAKGVPIKELKEFIGLNRISNNEKRIRFIYGIRPSINRRTRNG